MLLEYLATVKLRIRNCLVSLHRGVTKCLSAALLRKAVTYVYFQHAGGIEEVRVCA